MKATVLEQLATLQVRPDQIKYVAISHYHGDHTAQASGFPTATLLIGKTDWEILARPPTPEDPPVSPIAPWLAAGATNVQLVEGDKDIFGDGSVVMLATPGHSPGHHCLLVRLRDTGPIILSGDVAVFREAYEQNEVPSFADDRAASLPRSIASSASPPTSTRR